MLSKFGVRELWVELLGWALVFPYLKAPLWSLEPITPSSPDRDGTYNIGQSAREGTGCVGTSDGVSIDFLDRAGGLYGSSGESASTTRD